MTTHTYYVTTPIYYVNDTPHVGHAYTTILADALTRYQRLLGREAFLLTGVDEHGQKVARTAEAHGISPQAQADRTVVRFLRLWERLGIAYDDFIRTTEPRHVRVVQDALRVLYERGDIYRGAYTGRYCVPCERFLADGELADGRCPDCGRAVERIREEAYFFRQSRYQDWLREHIEHNPGFIRPAFRRNETLGFLRKPLRDLCISRPVSRLSWGIALPFDPAYVCYVWFDALLNYVSGAGYGYDAARFERCWPADCHLIGKDILTTHTVYWPCILRALDLPLPRSIVAHGWWLVEGEKVSKSKGNAVDPFELVARLGVDAFRYLLCADLTPGNDGTFSPERLVERYHADLAGGYGNLVSRVLSLVHRYCDARVPTVNRDETQHLGVHTAIHSAVACVPGAVDELRLDTVCAQVRALVDCCNRCLAEQRPWEEANAAQRPRVVRAVLDGVLAATVLLLPIAPDTATRVLTLLGVPAADWDLGALQDAARGLHAEATVGEPLVLFPRVK
ncbi:MAG: methionine--tRNA ligase [Chitinivibrionales bacterium]|nr:methionine--tRNA ligase [Chitinivibrionales bacterium]